MTKLLPCPFCGGEAILRQHSRQNSDYVWCSVCYAATDYANKRAVIKTWNTRTPPPDTELLKDLAVVRKIAEETVERVRGSSDVAGFEACVRGEMADMLRKVVRGCKPIIGKSQS